MLAMDSSLSPELAETCPPRSSPAAAAMSSLEQIESAPTSIRFLISNASAGSIIGKGGATINDFQSQSGARIQLSRNHEYFPGTSDRIIALSGKFKEVIKAFRLIVSKISNEDEKDAGQDTKSNQIKLIVPSAACGAIIGKGGATIRAFVEETNANIKLSPLNQSIPGVNERIVTIIGSADEQLHAVIRIASKLIEDPNHSNSTSTSLSYPALPVTGYGATSYLQSGMNGDLHMKGMPSSLTQTLPGASAGGQISSITLLIADEHVGAIVGREGKIITEIQQTTGARIKISDRGDYIPGTKNRKLTIMGTHEGVELAQRKVIQRIRSINSDNPRR
ncbi:hypothetical protein KP509_26G033000 [Ceratopteris richardii]|uniref:K Homology domain-containing protein n=1 Tax=Ceratopteris richardii TaxID=49495 RepID=A0A8T2RLU9_CERRI|nr:hypothetical protein KP509_26G033000 [Ceratopteris richardii]